MDDDKLDEIARELMDRVNSEYRKIALERQNTTISAPEIVAQVIFWVAAYESFGFDVGVDTIVDLGKVNSLQMKAHTWVNDDQGGYVH